MKHIYEQFFLDKTILFRFIFIKHLYILLLKMKEQRGIFYLYKTHFNTGFFL